MEAFARGELGFAAEEPGRVVREGSRTRKAERRQRRKERQKDAARLRAEQGELQDPEGLAKKRRREAKQEAQRRAADEGEAAWERRPRRTGEEDGEDGDGSGGPKRKRRIVLPVRNLEGGLELPEEDAADAAAEAPEPEAAPSRKDYKRKKAKKGRGEEGGEAGKGDGRPTPDAGANGAGAGRRGRAAPPPRPALGAGELKEQIAVGCTKLLADPEAHVGLLPGLLEFAEERDPLRASWAQISLVSVFKDIVPGYRVRLPTEEELKVRVSKDVQRVRDFERNLLRGYQQFLKALLRAAKGADSRDPAAQARARVAVKCMAGLLGSLPHFNYRRDLLAAIVPRMHAADPAIGQDCFDSIRQLFVNDREGEGAATLEAVQLIADLVRRKKCDVHPRVLRVLEALEFAPEIAPENTEKKKHVSKKARRKAAKEAAKKRGVDVEFDEASGKVNRDNALKLQAKTIEAVFEALFRIIKRFVGLSKSSAEEAAATVDPDSGAWAALDPSLRVIGKFAHLLNIDFLPDLFSNLRALLMRRDLPTKESLRCLQTVQKLLAGPGAALNLDASSFDKLLFHNVHRVPYVPPPAWDADDDPPNLRDLMEEALGAPQAQEALSVENVWSSFLQHRVMDQGRVAAFIKAVALGGAGLSSAGALAHLSLAMRLLQKYPRTRVMLDSDGVTGAAGFDLAAKEPEQMNALSTVLWELAVLGKHYHPEVARAAQGIAAMKENGLVADLNICRIPVPEVLGHFSTRYGGFKPAPQATCPRLKKAKLRRSFKDLRTKDA